MSDNQLLGVIRKLVSWGVDPSMIARPTGVSRRDFLKACGITGVSVAAGGLLIPKKKGIVTPKFPADTPELTHWDMDLTKYIGVDPSSGESTTEVGLVTSKEEMEEAFGEPSLSEAESKLLNKSLFEMLASSDPVAEKEAIDAVNDFTRTKLKEDGFFRKIMPPIKIPDDELADLQTEMAKHKDAADAAAFAAMSIPFQSIPQGHVDLNEAQAGGITKESVKDALALLPQTSQNVSGTVFVSTPHSQDNELQKLFAQGGMKHEPSNSHWSNDQPAHQHPTAEQLDRFLHGLGIRRRRRAISRR